MKKAKNIVLTITCAFLLMAGAASVDAQQTVHPGIVLYQQGKNDEAMRSLEAAIRSKEYRDDAEVWNTLGLVYFKKDDQKQARKALEKAIKLAPNIAAYHANLGYVLLLTGKVENAQSEAGTASRLDPRNTNALFILARVDLANGDLDAAEDHAKRLIAINPAVPEGYLLRSNILVTRLGKSVTAGWDVRDEIGLLKQARDVLAEGAEKCRSHPNHRAIDDEAEAISAFYDHFAREKPEKLSGADTPEPGVTPLKILNKPHPTYTNAARSRGISGVIKLAVMFSADGQIKYTLLLNQLGYGLDELAVRAAMGIKFVPQTKDGKPVSVVRMVEYSFQVY